MISPPSSIGAPGLHPDALIPVVDPYYGERRSALPLSVPPNENRAVWVDLFVDRFQAAANYSVVVTLTVKGQTAPEVLKFPLEIFDFVVPAVPTLKLAYGIWPMASILSQHSVPIPADCKPFEVCGGKQPGDDSTGCLLCMNHSARTKPVVDIVKRYLEAGLRNRISMTAGAALVGMSGFVPPRDKSTFDRWAAGWNGYLCSGVHVPGTTYTSRLTSLSLPAEAGEIRGHGAGFNASDYAALGRNLLNSFPTRRCIGNASLDLLYYTVDEPHTASDFASVRRQATKLHRGGDRAMKAFTTADVETAAQFNVTPASGVIDRWCPVINHYDPMRGAGVAEGGAVILHSLVRPFRRESLCIKEQGSEE